LNCKKKRSPNTIIKVKVALKIGYISINEKIKNTTLSEQFQNPIQKIVERGGKKNLTHLVYF